MGASGTMAARSFQTTLAGGIGEHPGSGKKDSSAQNRIENATWFRMQTRNRNPPPKRNQIAAGPWLQGDRKAPAVT